MASHLPVSPQCLGQPTSGPLQYGVLRAGSANSPLGHLDHKRMIIKEMAVVPSSENWRARRNSHAFLFLLTCLGAPTVQLRAYSSGESW